jgi:hypothetical protein
MPSRGPTFTIFNRLPIEVRLQIWEAALPGPRLINIKEKRLRKTKREHIAETCPDLDPATFPPDNLLGVTSDSKAPSVLFACRESYSVASKVYVPSFAFADSIPETYFDFRRDTLYLSCNKFGLFYEDVEGSWYKTGDELQRLYDRVNLGRVQNLAILLHPDPEEGARVAQPPDLALFLLLFGNVKYLTFVVGHFSRECDDQGDILLMEPIDVLKTYRNYEAVSSETSQHQGALDVPLITDFVPPAELEICLEELKRDLEGENFGEDWDPQFLPMPQIEYKSAVTGGLKRYLDGLRKGYQQKISEGNEIKLSLDMEEISQ